MCIAHRQLLSQSFKARVLRSAIPPGALGWHGDTYRSAIECLVLLPGFCNLKRRLVDGRTNRAKEFPPSQYNPVVVKHSETISPTSQRSTFHRSWLLLDSGSARSGTARSTDQICEVSIRCCPFICIDFVAA